MANDLPDDGPGYLILAGGFTVIGFALALGAWSSTMTVASAAIAPGIVTVEGHRKAVQASTSGPVKAVLVKEGDHVSAGQPLLELDLSDVVAELSVYRATMFQLMARQARLLAERAGSDELSIPDALRNAAADEPQVSGFIDQEQALFQARKTAYEGSVALVEQQVAGGKEQIVGLEGRERATRRQLSLLLQEKESLAPLAEKGIVAKNRILELDREAAALEAMIETILTDLAGARSRVQEGEIQIAQLRRTRAEEISDALSQAEAELSNVEPRVTAARQRLDRAIVLSPEAGFVYELAVFSSGAAVLPGQTIMEIVPADDALVLTVEVNPRDIDRIRPGQEASIHLLPFNRRFQSLIRGRLESISADLVHEERNDRSYYNAVVSVDRDDLERAGAELLPGMPAEVMINAGDRTIAEYFLDPILRLYDHALKER